MRNLQLPLQPEQRLVDLLLLLQPLVLNLQIEVALAEDVLVLLRDGLGLFVLARHQLFAQLAAQAAGKADQALGVSARYCLLTRGLR